MSYSYLKNVFPDFAAVKSYNEPIYGIVKKSEKAIQPSPMDDSQMAKYAQALINENKNALVSSDVETFTNDSEAHCDDYIKHILDCAQCKEMMMKHLKTDSDRIKNEEIMEIISFITFGVFILLVMENLKSK